MHKTRVLAGSTLGGAALLAAAVLPASAATSGDTKTTFELTGGGLSIAVATEAKLDSGNSGATSVSGKLGEVTVTDLRGGTTAWSAYAGTTAFTTTLGTETTVSQGVVYNAGLVTTTGVSVVAPGLDKALNDRPTKVVGSSAVVGNNTASWDPSLTVTLPSSSLAGVYTGTVTTGVA